jgi:hypothetical protein
MSRVNIIANAIIYLVMIPALAGCSSERLYQAFGSPDPVGPPVRYPLDYPICKDSEDGNKDTSEIVVPLQIRIYTAGIAEPARFTAQRKKDPNATGCLPYTQETQRSFVPSIHTNDHYNYGYPPRGQMLDMSGRGYFASVSYFEQLLNNNDFRIEAERRARIKGYNERDVAKGESTSVSVIELDEMITINGLEWRHIVTTSYDTFDLNNPKTGIRGGGDEYYEYMIDDGHMLRRYAYYAKEVQDDPEWLAARRNLLRQLVEAIHIEPISDQEIQVELEAHRLRRERDARWR